MNLVLHKGRKKVVVLITEDHMTVWAGTPEQFTDNIEPPSEDDTWQVFSTLEGLEIIEGPGAPYAWRSGTPVDEGLHDDIRWALPHLMGVAGLDFAVAEALDEQEAEGADDP
jgi:hypothetical protein